jgi:hypothetical protein
MNMERSSSQTSGALESDLINLHKMFALLATTYPIAMLLYTDHSHFKNKPSSDISVCYHKQWAEGSY